MTTLTVTTTDRQPAAVMRAEVPMEELRTVFDRGLGEVVRVAEAQGLTITGPPLRVLTPGCQPTPSRWPWASRCRIPSPRTVT